MLGEELEEKESGSLPVSVSSTVQALPGAVWRKMGTQTFAFLDSSFETRDLTLGLRCGAQRWRWISSCSSHRYRLKHSGPSA